MRTTDQRFEYRASIDILLNKFVAGTPYVCRAINISRGGMLLAKLLEPERADMSIVGLQFQLPGQDRIVTAAGSVVYEHPWLRAIGVRFTNLSDDHQKWVDKYLLEQMASRARTLAGERPLAP